MVGMDTCLLNSIFLSFFVIKKFSFIEAHWCPAKRPYSWSFFIARWSHVSKFVQRNISGIVTYNLAKCLYRGSHLYLFHHSAAWNADVMAGILAAILNHKERAIPYRWWNTEIIEHRSLKNFVESLLTALYCPLLDFSYLWEKLTFMLILNAVFAWYTCGLETKSRS